MALRGMQISFTSIKHPNKLMSTKEIELMEAFMVFIANAQTRSGVDFIFDSFQLPREHENTKAKGKVFIKTSNNKPDVPVTMEWDMNGNALMIGTQFDLVAEVPFHDMD